MVQAIAFSRAPQVEIALLEAGASYTSHGFDIYNIPAWFAQVNPLTGKIPAITYGGPDAPPEDPSPLSFKIAEAFVILEFLADLFPNSSLLPPVSDPTARARVRFFIDVVVRDVETPMFEIKSGVPGAYERLVEGLEKIQRLLPDPDAAEGGEYAFGKDFTNADCAVVPLLALFELATRTDYNKYEPGIGKKLGEALSGEKFDRLRRYKKAVWERESVKKAIDLDHIQGAWKEKIAQE